MQVPFWEYVAIAEVKFCAPIISPVKNLQLSVKKLNHSVPNFGHHDIAVVVILLLVIG